MLTYSVNQGTIDAETITIPDGKWVIKVRNYTISHYAGEAGKWRRHNQAVGSQVCSYPLARTPWRGPAFRGWELTSLFVGDEAFGVVTADSREGSGLTFTSAQRVKNGELSQRIRIDPLSITYSKHSTKKVGWVRLSKLATRVGLSPLEVTKRYFAFTDHHEPHLQTVQGDARLVRSRTWSRSNCVCLGAHQLTHNYWETLKTEEIWVRQGWALQVLQMRKLNYAPEEYPHLPKAFTM